MLEQIELIHTMNEDNATQEIVESIATVQTITYLQAVEDILIHKQRYIQANLPHEKEIFTLTKMIKLNRRLGNENAVLRDEVLLQSYELIRTQFRMIQSILRALDRLDLPEFKNHMAEQFTKNQIRNAQITNTDYFPYLAQTSTSKTFLQAQKNIRDYYAIIEVNADVLKYLSIFENRMYRLNRYSNYGLIAPILYINHSAYVQSINEYLSLYHLNVVKLLLIFLVFILMYLIRTVVYASIERLLLQIKSLARYSNELLKIIRRPLTRTIIIINIEMSIYIYNDFTSVEFLSRGFNMLYGFIFTLLVYKTLNQVATVKIEDIDNSDKKIKSEMINVGIKITNFLIMIFGLLLILQLAGANLTTVLSGLGIGGFAVALAARESLSNFFGTLSILLSDVFSQGDWIVVDGKQGVVVEIGLRVTTLRTFDNALIAIPNSILANQDVQNWSRRQIGRRMKLNLRIKYGAKAEDISSSVTQIREMLLNNEDIATINTEYKSSTNRSAKLVSFNDAEGIKNTLLVYLDEFTESSINILVYCFTKTTDWEEWLIVKQDVMYKIMDILEENSLEFAYPSLSLYHENSDKEEVSSNS